MTLREQLQVFLTRWEQARAGQVAKYRRRAAIYAPDGPRAQSTIYMAERRSLRHYQEELELLQRLQQLVATAQAPDLDQAAVAAAD